MTLEKIGVAAVVLLGFVAAVVYSGGCDAVEKNREDYLHSAYYEGSTGPGWIREVDWYHRSFVFENQWGTLVHLTPCRGVMPVWKGMHADIRFKIANESDGYCGMGEAYIQVTHLPPDLKE